MDPLEEYNRLTSRRAFLSQCATGMGTVALAGLLGGETVYAGSREGVREVGLPDLPHHIAKAKSVIYLFHNGAPTHVDLFDYKPLLQKMHGKPVPEEYIGDKRFSSMTGEASGKLLLAPLASFNQYGESGAWVSDFMPYTAQIVDEICFIKSMHTEAVNHAPAITFFLSGSEMPGRPALGAWLAYGLGSENADLPSYVVLTSKPKNVSCGQIFYDFYWGSGFLPSRYQGVKFRGGGDPVLYLSNPDGMSADIRRGMLDDIAALNEMKFDQSGDPEIETRISQYEMAFRMQTSVPELTDLTDEPDHVLDMYGSQVKERGTFAHNCLMARRLVERGTRCVQVMHAGWDNHFNITSELGTQCKVTDQPAAALVLDLKQHGLLDETLVIWGGEFGRTPFLQGNIKNRPRWGRDHHPYVFTTWLAGGGIKPGITYGASDDLGMDVAEKPVHVHDFQATLLHQLGIDHERLTYKFQGRNFRLTDVHGRVVNNILS